jgi:hypothetical protein
VYWGHRLEKKAADLIPPENFDPNIFGDIVERQKTEVARGWRILMTGIIFEVVAAFGISVISGLEIADLNIKTADAKQRTSLVESTNLMLSIQLESLRKEYGEFAQDVEMTVAPRMFRFSEEAVSRLAPFSNTPIALMYIGPGLRDPSSRRVPQWDDGEQLVRDMTSVLRQAKWNVIPAPTNLPNLLRARIDDLNAVWIAKKGLKVNWVTPEDLVEYTNQDKRIAQAAKCLADELTTNRIAAEISADGYLENETPMTLPHSMLLVVIGDHPNQFEEMRREEDRKRVGDRINNMQRKQNPSQPR